MCYDLKFEWFIFQLKVREFINIILLRRFRYQRWKQREFPEGAIVQDCRYHPCMVIENDKYDDHLQLMSILDFTSNGCSESHCGVYKMSAQEVKQHFKAYWKDGSRGLAILNGWTKEDYDEFCENWKS